jgi:hypothetical protein
MQKINGALILQQSKLNSTTFLDSVAYLEKIYKKCVLIWLKTNCIKMLAPNFIIF